MQKSRALNVYPSLCDYAHGHSTGDQGVPYKRVISSSSQIFPGIPGTRQTQTQQKLRLCLAACTEDPASDRGESRSGFGCGRNGTQHSSNQHQNKQFLSGSSRELLLHQQTQASHSQRWCLRITGQVSKRVCAEAWRCDGSA